MQTEPAGFPARAVRAYRCKCGRPIFFRNSTCLACGTALGYEPWLGQLYPLQPGQDGTWSIPGGKKRYRRCANLDSPAACNWLLSARDWDRGTTLCVSCRLNRTIPDLSVPENGEYWLRMEMAKRRLISSLIALRLPVASKMSEDPERGLAFDFLTPTPGGEPLLTGHASGVITIHLLEANDAVREQARTQLHEPYRTLLGHFRHESGHYYWDRLVANTHWLADFRELFGDEREDYQAALQRHYQAGAPTDWNTRYVSAYASSHPWEDWAETWAHYLHMSDTLDTARGFKLDIESVELPLEAFGTESLAHPEAENAAGFLRLLNSWARFTAVLNELSRSMGLPDFYPFVLSREVVAKLHLIHSLVDEQAPRGQQASAA